MLGSDKLKAIQKTFWKYAIDIISFYNKLANSFELKWAIEVISNNITKELC